MYTDQRASYAKPDDMLPAFGARTGTSGWVVTTAAVTNLPAQGSRQSSSSFCKLRRETQMNATSVLTLDVLLRNRLSLEE